MILDKFKEIASDVNNSYVRKFKENGGKIIGVSYSAVPVPELYHSVGMLGVRLRANEVNTTTIGDTYFGPVICSFPKSLLQMGGEGKYKFLDGLIISTCCDSMRRLDDCWRKAAEDIDGILPDYHYLFAVPHKAYDFSIEWLSDELKKHIGEIEAHFGVKVENERLWESVKLYNEARNLLRKFDHLRWGENVPLSGTDALSVFIAAGSIPIEDFIALLKELIGELESSSEKKEGKRLLIMGSANDDPSFFESIEDVGAVIVADVMSFGSKFYEYTVAEKGDSPVEELAKGYLTNLMHPRFFGEYKNRLEFVKKKAKDARVDGVVLQNIRFCDLHGCENSLYERDLESAGIPCLKIEREYGTLVETGRVKMRVQAFLERMR